MQGKLLTDFGGTLIIDFDGTITIDPHPAQDTQTIQQLNQPEKFKELLILAQQKNWNIFIVSNNNKPQIIENTLQIALGDDYKSLINGISYRGDQEEIQSKNHRIQDLIANHTLNKNFIKLAQPKILKNNFAILIDDQEQNNPLQENIKFIQAVKNPSFLNEASNLINKKPQQIKPQFQCMLNITNNHKYKQRHQQHQQQQHQHQQHQQQQHQHQQQQQQQQQHQHQQQQNNNQQNQKIFYNKDLRKLPAFHATFPPVNRFFQQQRKKHSPDLTLQIKGIGIEKNV